MSWASRRRFLYASGVILFFLIVVGGPIAYHILSIVPTCTDGKQDGAETGVDMGGPCPVLDPRYLQPHAVLWARSFKVRDGTYTAAAYIENPNQDAGVAQASYTFSLYDQQNILVAQRSGTTFVMPGSITPVLEPSIDTGNRVVAHTYFQFTSPLIWERMQNAASAISIGNKVISDIDTVPRISADAQNTSVGDILAPAFVAVVFDDAGNAFAASGTEIPRLDAGATNNIVFTWPDAFPTQVGRVDIIPLVPPVAAPTPPTSQ